MDLDNQVEIKINSYETYEDELMGIKAALEALIIVTDPDASKKLLANSKPCFRTWNKTRRSPTKSNRARCREPNSRRRSRIRLG